MKQNRIDKEMENLLKKLIDEEEFNFLQRVVSNQGVLEEKE